MDIDDVMKRRFTQKIKAAALDVFPSFNTPQCKIALLYDNSKCYSGKKTAAESNAILFRCMPSDWLQKINYINIIVVF